MDKTLRNYSGVMIKEELPINALINIPRHLIDTSARLPSCAGSIATFDFSSLVIFALACAPIWLRLVMQLLTRPQYPNALSSLS